MSFKNFVKPIPLTSVDASTIGAGYLPINAGGLPYACIKIRIANLSNVIVDISWDGVTAHDFLTPDDVIDLSFQATNSNGIWTPEVKKGQVFYAYSTQGAGVGEITLSGYYVEAQNG